ncbi:2-hydroxyacyl-CoA dehydratase family protein [Microbacterium sp. G2-8]|uniref:2-hydroxyacyl-CoA dehydratase family protein n=1 Tax=Microbacterium sp. G2-8 TaxID=2842454 RepID=UPI001C89A7AE|nr:2-hydroxyacyl-CoA dehydratase family protein [Microbacterium sp. G2-8]
MTSTPRVGVVGADLPRQVALAAGAVPTRLLGAWEGDTSREARELLGAMDVVAVRILDEILAGAHDHLAGLVVCNDSSANLRLFYVLRVLAERGRVRLPVSLFDAPRGSGSPREHFVARRIARLTEFCEAVTGSGPSDFAAAAASEDALGGALRGLRARRRSGRVTGAAALDAYRAAATLAPEEAALEVDRVDRSAAGIPVVVTGGSHPDSSVYAAIENEGLLVVGDDHDTGDAAWIGPTGRDAAEIARLHAARPPLAQRSRSSERAAALAALVTETKARGVISLARELDDAPAWDLAAQRAAIDVPLVARTRIAPDAARTQAVDAARELRDRITEEGA